MSLLCCKTKSIYGRKYKTRTGRRLDHANLILVPYASSTEQMNRFFLTMRILAVRLEKASLESEAK